MELPLTFCCRWDMVDIFYFPEAGSCTYCCLLSLSSAARWLCYPEVKEDQWCE